MGFEFSDCDYTRKDTIINAREIERYNVTNQYIYELNNHDQIAVIVHLHNLNNCTFIYKKNKKHTHSGIGSPIHFKTKCFYREVSVKLHLFNFSGDEVK